MGKIKKNFVLENLEVVDISTEGKAVARHEGLVVFIEGAVPGDLVDVMVFRKKNSFAEGRLHQLRRPSPNRVTPPCKHFGVCGGCKWQNLDYATQLQFKQKYVYDAFTRIGKLTFNAIAPIRGNQSDYFYRNKMEFSFSNKKWLTTEQLEAGLADADRNGLGFHIPGMFDKILDIDHCHLQGDPSNAIRNAVRDYAARHGLSFFDIRNRGGLLRTLLIRTASTGEVMVLLAVYEWDEPAVMALLAFLKTEFPQITSLLFAHNPKANDTLNDLEIQVYHGRDYILEEMEGLQFRVSAKSFYQTNSQQAHVLYTIAREFAGLSGNEVVYDLYTGTGTIANFVARQAAKVVGIEYVEDAIADAKKNSEANGITNTHFFAGDMKNVLTEAFIATHGRPDVVITDPPRAGMHEDVVQAIRFAAPQRIVYVSCNPATQARDLALLEDVYSIVEVQPVDMFPQTAHVENVVLLHRKS